MKSKDILNKQNGFTLVEVLVAVGILSATSLAFLPSFSKANREKNLKQNSENVRDAITTSRNRALTEVNNPGAGAKYSYSGIKFTNGSDSYVLFRSSAATTEVCNNLPSATTVVDSTRKLSNEVKARVNTVVNVATGTINESPTCIFFEFGTGNAYVTKGPYDAVNPGNNYALKSCRNI